MGHPWIIVLVVSLQGATVITEARKKISDTLWLYDTKVTWDEAFQTCRDTNATFAVPTAEEVEVLRQLLPTSDNVWVAQYTYTSPWMYPTGCFSSAENHRIEKNDISECQRFCGGSDILVNLYNCLCVDGAPDVSTRKPLQLCNISCPGQREDYCGGHGVYHHYTTYTDIKRDTGESNFNCGMAEKGSSIVITARRCLIPKPFICAVDYNDSSERPFYIPRDTNGKALILNFQNALEHCVNKGSYLADPTKLSVSQFRHGEPSLYWVGVRRRLVYVKFVKEPSSQYSIVNFCPYIAFFRVAFILDTPGVPITYDLYTPLDYLIVNRRQQNRTDLPSNVTNQKCLYIINRSAGISPTRSQDCTTKTLFLCRKKPQNENDTAVTGISDVRTTTDITGAVTGIPDAITSAAITRPEATAIPDVHTKAATPSSTTDLNNIEPPVTQSDIWPYIIGGCATISVLTALGVIVCVRRRRHRTEEATDIDIIPLETHNYDYLDIKVGAIEHESRRLPEGDTEKSHTASAGEATGQRGITAFNSLKNESNPHSRDLSGSIRDDAPYDLAQNCDNLYDLANNALNEQSAKHGGSLLEHEASQNFIRHVAPDSDLYNGLHKDRPRHHSRDDVYDHIGALSCSDEELYHKIHKPGYRNREEDLNVYDTTQNTLDSGVYNTLTNATASVNGNDTFNPYADDTNSDPLP